MEGLSDWLGSSFGPVWGMAPLMLGAVVVFAVFLLLGRVLSAGLERVFPAGSERGASARLVQRGIRWAFAAIGTVLALQILGLTAVATSLLATGGLLAVILGFAFREIGENLLAGLFLGMSRSFEVGDLIESSGHTGRVREIDLRHVHLRSSDGRDLFIPSAQILRNVLVNFTRDGLRRGDFVVGVDFADPLHEVEALLLESTGRVPGVLEEPPPGVRISAFTPQYAEFQVLFWIDTDGGSDLAVVRTDVMHACIETLKDRGFTLSSSVSAAVDLSPVDVSLRNSDS